VGGVTTIFGMPNLNPPTNDTVTLTDVFDRYARTSIVDYNHNPAPTKYDQIQPMADMGVCAYKIYMVVDTGRTYPHPAGTGHARPRRSAEDDGPDRRHRKAIHHPST